MIAKLYSQIHATPTEKLVVILEFFDCPELRSYFTGLIDDIRNELAERGVYPP